MAMITAGSPFRPPYGSRVGRWALATALCIALSLLAVPALVRDPVSATGAGHAAAGRPSTVSALAGTRGYGGLPLSFERNRGQVDGQVRFLTHGPGYTLYLTPRDAVLAFPSPCLFARTRDVGRHREAVCRRLGGRGRTRGGGPLLRGPALQGGGTSRHAPCCAGDEYLRL